MTDWKFGTVLRRVETQFVVMVIGRNESGNYLNTDEYGVAPGEWVGLTIADPENGTSDGFYPVGGTCMVEDARDEIVWEVVE